MQSRHRAAGRRLEGQAGPVAEGPRDLQRIERAHIADDPSQREVHPGDGNRRQRHGRRRRDIGHRDRERLTRGDQTVADLDRGAGGAGARPIRRRPGKDPGRGINDRAGRRTGSQAVGQRLRREIGIRRRDRNAEQHTFCHRLWPDGRQHRCHVHFRDRNRDSLTGRHHTVAHREGHHRAARPLCFRRRPTERSRGRVEGRTGRQARRAVHQRLLWKIGIGRRDRKAEETAFGHRLWPDGCQHRCHVDFIDRDRDNLAGGRNAIRDREGDWETPWSLVFRRRPAECSRGRVERGTGREARRAVDQSLLWQIGIRRTNDEGQQCTFCHGLRPNGRQDRRDIHFGHGDRDRLTGRDDPVAHREGHHRAARPLCFRRRPTERSRGRVEGRTGRQARRTVGQGLRRHIGIRRDNGEAQYGTFVHRLRSDRRQNGGRIAGIHCHREGLPDRHHAIRHVDREAVGIRRLSDRRRPGEDATHRVDGGAGRGTGGQTEG